MGRGSEREDLKTLGDNVAVGDPHSLGEAGGARGEGEEATDLGVCAICRDLYGGCLGRGPVGGTLTDEVLDGLVVRKGIFEEEYPRQGDTSCVGCLGGDRDGGGGSGDILRFGGYEGMGHF